MSTEGSHAICRNINDDLISRLQTLMGDSYNPNRMVIKRNHIPQNESLNYETGNILELIPFMYKRQHHKSKRSQVIKPFSPELPLPWSCEGRVAWRDLGPDYFPRYIREVECAQRTCWYSHYKCRAKPYTLKVLKRNSIACNRSDAASLDISVLWGFHDIETTLSCECSR